jgi:hypothetical protein
MPKGIRVSRDSEELSKKRAMPSDTEILECLYERFNARDMHHASRNVLVRGDLGSLVA